MFYINGANAVQSAAQVAEWHQFSAKRGVAPAISQSCHIVFFLIIRLRPTMQCECHDFFSSGLEIGSVFWASNFINPSHSSSFIIRCENPAKRTCCAVWVTINHRVVSDAICRRTRNGPIKASWIAWFNVNMTFFNELCTDIPGHFVISWL